MNIGLLTFTRDRLDYTRHCFASLQKNAGCEYDHWVLDQASTDGTVGFLTEWVDLWPGRHVVLAKKNMGICPAANHLIDLMDPAKYDVIVRYDNDCEVTQPDTLKVCADLAYRFGAITAPRINGLNNPPAAIRTVSLGGTLLDETAVLGGIFMCVPAFMFAEMGYRFDENHPPATGDEAIVPWARAHGGVCGYVQDYSVNHFETTEGQKARYPSYEDRKRRELAA